MEATLALGNRDQHDAIANRWRFQIQRHYTDARARVSKQIAEAQADRSVMQSERALEIAFAPGSLVWLFIDRVKVGYARKLAHQWHGPFVIAEIVEEFAVKLETRDADYRFFPVVHVSKLKLAKQFPERLIGPLTVREDDRYDFDEALLLEDSWEPEKFGDNVYEVEEIRDLREGRRTRFGRNVREFLVKWRGFDDPQDLT